MEQFSFTLKQKGLNGTDFFKGGTDVTFFDTAAV
jgi:hypothetical protein